jgi:hypothetical protein
VTAENKAGVRIGDIGIATCGHPTVALTGSATYEVEKSKVHRQNDVGSNPGPYVAVAAASTITNDR